MKNARSRLGTVSVRGRRIPVRRRSLPRSIWGMTYRIDPDPEIQVSRRLRSPRSVLITAWHEALHHAFPKLRESQILQIEQQTVLLLRDNPGFVRRLIHELRAGLPGRTARRRRVRRTSTKRRSGSR